jgi:hypothetical protein
MFTVPPPVSAARLRPDLRQPTHAGDRFYWGLSGLVVGITSLLAYQHTRRRRDQPRGYATAPSPLSTTELHENTSFMPFSASKSWLTQAKHRPLPINLTSHFNLEPGEQVMWAASYRRICGTTGVTAVTSQRIIAVHYRGRLSWLANALGNPGNIGYVSDRVTDPSTDEILLSDLSKADILRTHRSWLLLIPALTLWIHPWGLGVAIMALIAYSAFPQRQLAVFTGRARYLYPLSDLDQREMLYMIQPIIPPVTAQLRAA